MKAGVEIKNCRLIINYYGTLWYHYGTLLVSLHCPLSNPDESCVDAIKVQDLYVDLIVIDPEAFEVFL